MDLEPKLPPIHYTLLKIATDFQEDKLTDREFIRQIEEISLNIQIKEWRDAVDCEKEEQ